MSDLFVLSIMFYMFGFLNGIFLFVKCLSVNDIYHFIVYTSYCLLVSV